MTKVKKNVSAAPRMHSSYLGAIRTFFTPKRKQPAQRVYAILNIIRFNSVRAYVDWSESNTLRNAAQHHAHMTIVVAYQACTDVNAIANCLWKCSA